jgi:uncharacterized tellurite resistance protein B-like protein
MSLMEFKNVLKFLRGEEPSAEEKKELFKEVALMTLARATRSDTNIQAVELESVQDILLRVTGEEIDLAEIRTAAHSEVFERRPLHKYLAGVGQKLDASSRTSILQCLIEVIRSNEEISHFETEYFDMVAEALSATPSEISGLVAH